MEIKIEYDDNVRKNLYTSLSEFLKWGYHIVGESHKIFINSNIISFNEKQKIIDFDVVYFGDEYRVLIVTYYFEEENVILTYQIKLKKYIIDFLEKFNEKGRDDE